MSKKKWWFAALGAGALGAVALPLFAGGQCERGGWGKHGHGMMSERMIDKMSKRLKLDKNQRTTLYAAVDEARPALRAAREQLRESRRALHEFDPKAADYDGKVARLAKTHGELAVRMTMLAAGMKSTLVDVLNDAQEKKLKEYMARRHHRHHGDGGDGDDD
ncbi:MAG: Spy/CpxP family protein refolding chaperone [Gammaproteobacteria bacterium]